MVVRKGTFQGILFTYGYFTFIRYIHNHLFTFVTHPWLITLFSVGSISDHELMMSSNSQYFVPNSLSAKFSPRDVCPLSANLEHLSWRHFADGHSSSLTSQSGAQIMMWLLLCVYVWWVSTHSRCAQCLRRPRICPCIPTVSQLDVSRARQRCDRGSSPERVTTLIDQRFIQPTLSKNSPKHGWKWRAFIHFSINIFKDVW